MDYSLLVVVETNKKWIDMQVQMMKKGKPSQRRKDTKNSDGGPP
jgi:hypothetical protein